MSLPSPPASPRDGDNVKLFINERVSEEKSQNDADESKENIESLLSTNMKMSTKNFYKPLHEEYGTMTVVLRISGTTYLIMVIVTPMMKNI